MIVDESVRDILTLFYRKTQSMHCMYRLAIVQ